MADIIGLSCRFPESNGPSEFWSNLMHGKDMVTADDRRWPVGFQGLPPRTGKLPGFDKFDAAFFSVHGKQAQKMDPQLRKLLEVSYEAWVDAGVDFSALRGSDRVGVYVGACGSETHAQWLGDIPNITGYEQTGCAQSMFPNRLSWWFDFRGPSKCIDTACSSSLMAFNDAMTDLTTGRIDYAVVGGASGIFRPQTSIAFQRLHMMSPDGICKSFDASANGYARADGIAIVVLRKAGLKEQIGTWAARHPYAQVLACATNNDGHTKEGITFPSGPAQKALAQEVCTKAGLEPSAISYIEAHGTGTVAGDGQELGALEEWYGRSGNRTAEDPLLIGSVKSNMGHCEGCSGLAALIKVLLSYEHQTLPGNLHFSTPNPNNAGLKDGILKVVTEPTEFKQGIVALSNFGFGGSNVHLLLKNCGSSEPKATAKVTEITEGEEAPAEAAIEEKDGATSEIIPLATRTKEGMAALVKVLKGLPGGEKTVVDPLRRLANTVGRDSKLSTRGTLVDGELRSAQGPGSAPPVWFVFTGNGSQWPRMGKELLETNATFRKSIEICAKALKPYNIDLIAAYESEEGFGDARTAAVGLASIQIGLVDVLREEYGITPGGVLGHSAGEIACGYGDGCFTREQTVLVAYHRGRMCPEHNISGGLMAAVGLGAEEAEARLAKHGNDSCVVGCDNSPNSVTLSGPEEDIRPLLEQLKAENVFVRELDTRGLAFHSPVLQPHLGELKEALESVVPEPKARSATWLSSTYAVDDESEEAKYCSGGYQTHGYASRVQFRLACTKIPKDVLLLEIGPHALMRSPLRQNRSDLQYVATMKKGESAVETLSAAVADLWRKGAIFSWPASAAPSAGVHPELFRAVREALVSWDHSADYPLPKSKDWTSAGGAAGFTKTYKLGEEHSFLADHVVDGRILMPATSYLVTAWEALAAQQETTMDELPVTFEDVSIVQAVQAQPGENVTLSVTLDRSHRFQVLQETDIIAEGRIKARNAPNAPKKEEESKDESAEAPGDTVAPPAEGAAAEAAPAPAAEAPEAEPAAAEGAAAPAEEAEPAEPTTVEWPYDALDTVEAGTFYLDVARAGIQYGPHFKMVHKRHIQGKQVVLRWDGCFIRLLDGMLQAGALGSSDYQLRIPTKIRQLDIIDPKPALPAGSEMMVDVDADVGVCATECCIVAGVELSSAPRRPINYKTLLKKMDFVAYGENKDTDALRLAYYKQIRGYIKARVQPAIEAVKASAEEFPQHLEKIMVMLEDLHDPAPEGAELEEFLAHPKHHLARLIRDLFDDEAAPTTMENPIQAIVQHSEHNVLYAQDPLMQGFHSRHISHMLDIVCENQGQTGFSVAEVGAGTGGFTRQVIAELDRSPFSELRSYTATDITPAFGPNLLQLVNNSKLEFKTWDVNKAAPESLGGPFNLMLASNAVHTCDNMAETLSNIHGSLADGGFVMLYETTAAYTTCLWGLDERTWNFTDEREYGLWIAKPRWDKLWANAGFERVIAHWCPQESGALFLYRKVEKVPEPVLLAAPPVKVTEEEAEEFIKTFNETLEAVDPETIAKAAAPAEGEAAAEPAAELPVKAAWLHGNLRDNPGVLGLGHCARLERFGDNLRWILDANHPSSALTNAGSKGAQPALSAQQMLATAGKLDLVNNVFQNGVHGSLRNTIVELEEVNEAAAEGKDPAFGVHLDIASYGDMSSFFWAHSQPPPPGLLECNVSYGSLNFRDVMLAYGKLSKDLMSHGHGGHQIGLEFSGKDKSSGKRIMGMTPQNSIATMVASKPHALWDVPDNWTLAQSATVPVAYATAYDALVVRGRLQPHHRVLIHSATGAVGLAATRICLNRGCEVFVTCGTADKRAFLLEAFPRLREDHIGDSRSCSFEETVKRQTAGKGVHLALNSLADDKLQATVRCLADNGRLLEIGKYDILKGTPLSMRPMLRNCAFEGIDLDRIVNDPSNITEAWEVHALLAAGIASGEVVPLPLNRFARKDAGNAFRFMAAGTHMGKVLIQMAADADKETVSAEKAVFQWPAPPKKAETEESEEAQEPASASSTEIAEPSATPVFFCKEDRSYIITGGLGGFGLALAVWLANQGAKNLVMTSKRGMRTGGQRKVIELLRSRGVNVEVSKLDVADMEEAKGVVALAQKQGPVGGIFHLAMILQDRWMANQTGESWNAPIIPKAYGALNLDALSDSLPHLEQFVIFSSVVSSTGNEGQGNYGYANSVCDMLCMSRRAAGKPALAIAWGPVDHVGYVAEILKGKLVGRVFEWLLPQPVDDCLRVLSSCLLGGKNVTPLMCSTTETIGSNSADDGEDTDLVEAVLNLMGLKADAVGENDNLAALGIDSMQLMEVRAVMQKKLCRPIPLEMIGSLTVATLRELAAEGGSKGGRSSAPPAEAAAAPKEASAPGEPAQEEAKAAAAAPVQAQPQLAAKKPAAAKEIAITAHAERPRKSQVVTPVKADMHSVDDAAPAPVSALPAAPTAAPASPTTAVSAEPARPTSGSRPTSAPRPTSSSRPSSAKAETASKASAKTDAAASQSAWTAYTAVGVLYIGVVLALVGFPAASTATWVGSTFGVWALLPVLPAIWLGIGAALCLACVVTSRLFQPRLSSSCPIPMYSLEFAQWWLVSRMVNVTTYVFADHLRGTPFLNWWFRAMGAHIGEGCHIDTLDVCDFELVTLGDNVVLNEGSSITGHYFQDGCLHLKEVELGSGSRLEPFAMAKAGVTLAAGASMAPQCTEAVNAAAAKKRGAKPAPVLGALSTQLHSRALTASETAYMQVAGLWAVGATATLAALAAYFVLGGFLYVGGLPAEVALSPAAYAVFGLAALFNPLYAAILPILLPVTPAAAAATLAAVTSPIFVVFAAVFVPLAMILFGLNLSALSIAFKWAVAGRVVPGVHKLHSVRGVQLWAAARMVELTFKRFMMMCSGTWAMNYYLRALGAKIGDWSTFRLGMCLPLLPDSLELGSGVHVGDMANLVYSSAIDSESAVTATVKLEDHALIGAAAVAMPGTTLGKGSTLGAMAASLPGAQLPGEMLYMGSPAQPVFKSAGSEKPAGPKQEKAKLMFQTWPFVQPAIAFGISTFSTYITAVFALAAVALYGGALQSSTPLLLTVAAGLWALYGSLLGSLGAAAKWSFTGRLEPHAGFPMYDSLSFRRALVLISEIPLGPFAEAVRASPIYNMFARLRGMTVGKGAFLDSVRLLDYELASFGEYAIVSRNALVYCHLASHKKGKLVVYQKRSTFGAHCILGARSITLPGYTLADKASLAPVSLGAPAMSF